MGDSTLPDNIVAAFRVGQAFASSDLTRTAITAAVKESLAEVDKLLEYCDSDMAIQLDLLDKCSDYYSLREVIC